MNEIVLLLLGYPISVLANFSTSYFLDYFKNQDQTPLKSLFIKSLFKSLDSNKKRVDSIGGKAISQCKNEIQKDKEKLFRIIAKCIIDQDISFENIRKDFFKEEIAKELIKDFNLFHISLAKNVIFDCFENYEIAFFSEMSTRDGMIYLVKLLNKINSAIVKPEDIEELKKFLVSELDKIKIENKLPEYAELIIEETKNPESEYFSDSIIFNMKYLKKTIEKLTKDQFQIIHYLRYYKRVIISGCAGSGKTLLAAEKSIRLENSGIKTLILTHNPNLADHIKSLVSNHKIEVYDFTNYIYFLIGKNPIDLIDWNEFIEPLSSELGVAFDIIISKKISYDAVIIDEGQDFRELWWMIVEALSINSLNKILYIFHDDRQKLLPTNFNYPIDKSPFILTKNCRNAGNIFEIVRKFHVDAPITSEFLKDIGILKISVFSNKQFEEIIESAIIEADKTIEISNLNIITNEQSVEKSVLNGKEIIYTLNTDWRSAVQNDMEILKRKAISQIEKEKNSNNFSDICSKFKIPLDIEPKEYLKTPTLNANRIPTENDVMLVCNYTIKLKPFLERRGLDGGFNTHETDKEDFKIKGHLKRKGYDNVSEKLRLYSSKEWASILLNTKLLKICPKNSWHGKTDNISLNLSTVDMFKGLESDSVILFINTMNKDIFKELYVGTSRAIGYLHILINNTVYEKINQLKEHRKYVTPPKFIGIKRNTSQ